MEKSYAKVAKRAQRDPVSDAVAEAARSLRRHSSGGVICSRCVNDDTNRFEVTSIDVATGCVTEVKCKRCKESSSVCHSRCCCQRYPPSSRMESSYKEQIRASAVQQLPSKSITTCMFSILEATVTVLLRKGNGDVSLPCSSCNWAAIRGQIIVTSVDRLGFITRIRCPEPQCRRELDLSPLEESYVVQMMHRGQLDRVDSMQLGGDRDHLERNISELCDLLRRHSFYEDAVCPESRNNDPESCRVVAIDKDTERVNEVEFVADNYNQSLVITCRSGCYYDKYPSRAPSRYERSYKEKVAAQLDRAEQRPKKAILSCTVLAGTAAILRRHNIDNTLCQNCQNDDHEYLRVKGVDSLGFITSVGCDICGREQSVACYRSPFYYEEIDESLALRRGDHVSWHRGYLLWHHAVVTRVDDETLTFAEYTTTPDHPCHFRLMETTQRRRDVSTGLCSGIPYRITYEDCYTNEYTALRAERSIEEERYHVVNRNCEHTSFWCKTGLHKSAQVATLARSTWKTFLAYGLRIVNLLLLMAFQVIHEQREDNQRNREAFELFERILVSVYMSVVFLLFLVWSLYTECKKQRPNYADRRCCSRPPRVVSALYVRIITRELVAVAGQFAVIFFEDDILRWCKDNIPKLVASEWRELVVISIVFLLASVLFYLLGALLGTVFENRINRCSIRLRKHSGMRREPNREASSSSSDNGADSISTDIAPAVPMNRRCDDTDTSNLTQNMQI